MKVNKLEWLYQFKRGDTISVEEVAKLKLDFFMRKVINSGMALSARNGYILFIKDTPKLKNIEELTPMLLSKESLMKLKYLFWVNNAFDFKDLVPSFFAVMAYVLRADIWQTFYAQMIMYEFDGLKKSTVYQFLYQLHQIGILNCSDGIFTKIDDPIEIYTSSILNDLHNICKNL